MRDQSILAAAVGSELGAGSSAATTVHPYYRVISDDADTFSLQNEAQMYSVPFSTMDKLYTGLVLPFNSRSEFNTFSKCSFLIRRPFLDIVNAIKYMHPENPVNRFFFCTEKMVLEKHLRCANWSITRIPEVGLSFMCLMLNNGIRLSAKFLCQRGN